MRLYRTADGQWAGTQRDAREIAGKDWVEVEVPTDKWGLLEWLNKRDARSDGAAAEMPRQPLSAAIVADPVRAVQQHNIAVEEEIAGSDLPTAIRLFDHVTWRIAELIKPARTAAGK